MSRYVDVANFCENICRCNNNYCNKQSCPILNAPAVDVQEVRHGEWISISDGDAAECSECGGYFDMSENGGMAPFRLFEKFYKYCPNCGAKMDAEAITSANVEPVVRCKDCKKSSLTELGKRYCSEPMGAFYGCIPVEDNFFCSGGKRLEAIDDE